MDTKVGYDMGQLLVNNITVPTTLTVTETDLFISKLSGDLQKSQFTVYVSVDLGGVTSCTFYYYFSVDGGTTWYPVSLYNTSTGEITQRAVVVDAGTYSISGHSRFADNVPVAATTQFKVTGKSSSATPTLNTVMVMGRDN